MGRVRLLRRGQLISRHRGMPQVSPHYRIGTGPLAYRSLAVNGLDTASNPSRDGRCGSGYAWWLLGSPQPEKVARAIEDAMVADGHTRARGLAARAVEQEIVVPWTPGPSPLRPRTR